MFLEYAGTYECYWHFYHNGERFGQWLGCNIIVDEPVKMDNFYYQIPPNMACFQGSNLKLQSYEVSTKLENKNLPDNLADSNLKLLNDDHETDKFTSQNFDHSISNLNNNFKEIILESTGDCSDSDNQSTVSNANSVSSLSSGYLIVDLTEDEKCMDNKDNSFQEDSKFEFVNDYTASSSHSILNVINENSSATLENNEVSTSKTVNSDDSGMYILIKQI